MILRLRLNKMDLQRREHPLSLCQCHSDHPRRIFGHRRAAADLMNANGPIRSDQLQHDPPLHPKLPVFARIRSFAYNILRRNQTRTFSQDRYAAALAGPDALSKWSVS
jgi:hypothetical protein